MFIQGNSLMLNIARPLLWRSRKVVKSGMFDFNIAPYVLELSCNITFNYNIIKCLYHTSDLHRTCSECNKSVFRFKVYIVMFCCAFLAYVLRHITAVRQRTIQTSIKQKIKYPIKNKTLITIDYTNM